MSPMFNILHMQMFNMLHNYSPAKKWGPIPAVITKCKTTYPYGLDHIYADKGTAMVVSSLLL